MSDVTNLIYFIGLILLPVIILFILYRCSILVFESLTHSFKISVIITLFIILSTFLPTFFFPRSEQIFICSLLNWRLYIHPVGFVFPILFSTLLFIRKKMHWKFLILSLIPVVLMSYFVTTPILEKGIVSPFPLWLFPPFMSALICVLNKEKLEGIACSYAFIIGVFSIIIGADIAHLPTLLQYTSTSSMQAIFGGAGSLDLIFLSGVFSVVFTKLFLFIQERLNLNQIDDTKYVHM